MRKLTFVAIVLFALVATSYAVANGIEGAKTATPVAATFTATASSSSTKTCTTTDNKTIVVTDGTYTGTATGTADLTGPITLRARSVVNTTDAVGTVSGSIGIDVANGKNTQANYTAVYDHGNIAGLASGKAHEPNAKLVANLSAAFVPGSGFTSGKLGGGTAGGAAVEVGTGGCKPSGPSTEKSSAHGTISALSSSSITVAGLTCAISADTSADVLAKYKLGDTVQIGCAFANGANTLTAISAKKH